MKYIFTLSLSGICLAIFVLVIQGNTVSADIDFGRLLNKQLEAAVPVVKVETVPVAKRVESKTVVAEPAKKQRVTTAEKRPLTRTEAIKEAVKDRPWEEAKPDVIRILNDYSTKKGEVWQDRAPVESREYRDRGYKGKVRDGITEDEAVTIALKDTPGEMIGVKWKKGNYRVKVWSESEGATYKIYIDPQSGEVVKRKRKS